jgi:hypothetical protein
MCSDFCTVVTINTMIILKYSSYKSDFYVDFYKTESFEGKNGREKTYYVVK